MSTTAPSRSHSRRDVLKLLGAGTAMLGTTSLLAACDDDDPITDDGRDFDTVTIDFSNDFGVLNYAYALEQLEAAFYAAVTGNAAFNRTFSNEEERRILRDLQAHEEIHRDFLAAAIPALGGTAIGMLTPNFEAVDFSSRASILGTAQVFEDLGVAAYNGAGARLNDATLLTLAGKIVSVEARHASVVSGLLEANSIAGDGVINEIALDRALDPGVVLGADGAAPFIRNELRAINL
jgi:rubrerythrin